LGWYLPSLFKEFSGLVELAESFEGIGYYSEDLADESPVKCGVMRGAKTRGTERG
jgi:hypothetical protein